MKRFSGLFDMVPKIQWDQLLAAGWDMIVTHPDNRGLLIERCKSLAQPGIWRDDFCGLPVKFDPHMAARTIREDWYPPADGKFTSYGPEDEHWMRPLGIGRIERVDEGPIFWLMKEPLRIRTSFDFAPVINARSFLMSSMV